VAKCKGFTPGQAIPVFVTLDFYKDLRGELHVFRDGREADKMEEAWLKENGVKDGVEREMLAQQGTEFIIWETTLE